MRLYPWGCFAQEVPQSVHRRREEIKEYEMRCLVLIQESSAPDPSTGLFPGVFRGWDGGGGER